MSEWNKPEDTAKKLNMCKRTLMRHVDRGEITYVNVGHGQKRRMIRFTDSDIEAFENNHRRIEACPSSPEAKKASTPTRSKSVVSLFSDRLAAQRSAKLSPSKRKPSKTP